MEKLFYPIKKPASRYERRKMVDQANKLKEWFDPIEETFIVNVFTSDLPYETLYKESLADFKSMCEWVNASRKCRYFKLNEHYFSNQYKSEV